MNLETADIGTFDKFFDNIWTTSPLKSMENWLYENFKKV